MTMTTTTTTMRETLQLIRHEHRMDYSRLFMKPGEGNILEFNFHLVKSTGSTEQTMTTYSKDRFLGLTAKEVIDNETLASPLVITITEVKKPPEGEADLMSLG